jgi:peptidoglycan/xylan/chitin deacetylase (PgdA/CDA1 family)
MNFSYKFFVAFLFLGFFTNAFSQEVDSAYEVGTWHGFRTSAVSFTFDDGTANQFTKAIPIFDEYGFKLTLFTVINWSSGNWNALKSAAANGHEVASHTMTHPYLGPMTIEQQTEELRNSKNQINSQIRGEQCITIAYPYCEVSNYAVCREYYIAARGCSGSIESRTPSDFFNISSIICGTEGPVKTVQDFNNRANSAASSKGWLVYLLHGVDNDGGWSPVVSDTLRGALEYLNSNPSKFWVSSFSNVVRYIRERNSTSVVELSVTDSIITCEITDTLDNEIYNFPVTVRRELPEGWISASVSQDGSIISSQVVEIDSKKYVMFDAVPDNGAVSIINGPATNVNDKDKTQLYEPTLKQNYPNPFNPWTKIKYSVPTPVSPLLGGVRGGLTRVGIKIYDILGNEVAALVNEEKAPGEYEVIFDASGLSSGIYFYRIITGTFIETKKMILLY